MELDESIADCPQFVNFACTSSRSGNDSWFFQKNQEQSDAFLRTVDLNSLGSIRQIPQPQRKARQGSYTECPSSTESKKRKSHPMRTRQDSRMSCEGDGTADEEEEEEEEEGEEVMAQVAPPLPKPSRQPVAAKKSKPEPKPEKSDKFESMSEKVIKFFHKTPSRFKMKPDPKESTAVPPRNTRPVTPRFATDKRVRGALHVKSAAEREEEELQAMKAAQFRAHPLPGRRPLMRSASVNQADPGRRRFGLASTFDRLAKPKETSEPEPELAKPLKDKRTAVTGCTVAQSPMLETKKRALGSHSLTSGSGESLSGRCESNYHPAPHFGRAFQPRLEHKHTAPQPFSFLERERQRQAEKEQRLKEKSVTEAKPAFKAQLLPSSSPDELPQKKTRPVTRTQSFELRSEARGNAYWQKFERDREDSEEARAQRKKFRAKSPEVLRKPAFEPARNSRFVEPNAPPALATASRAEVRQKFEATLAAKEREAELDQERQEAAEAARAEAEAAAQRREAVHRANPVRQYRPLAVQPSSKPITVAKSPKFSKRFNK